ncbi:hypothetical protein [Cardiobacterium valvarum]|uniref:Uncharacterized protein n=1 Tax=Cardiobacterium valvarum TaxID=194702 RepID=A0A381ECZ6_9GAMM|nr:hypothetical protein [Cardiobacterium valvarum]SUX24810.1 Uncharacterised protein [Cardiobacterium valvarum]
MTSTAKPAQRTFRLWAKMALLLVLLVCLLAAFDYSDNINATAGNLYTLSHSDNSRVKAMAAGLAAYNLQQSMMQFQQGGKGGAGGGGGNTKIAITYGVSKSKSETKSDWQGVQAAQTTADGTVYMQVRGGGGNSTYTNTGSDIGGGERTVFDVEGKKTFQSVLTNQHLRNDNRSWEAHGGIAFDRNTIGVNAGGAIAGGYYEGTEGLHRLSRVGSLTGHTDLGEGKTTLHGGQVFGRSIRARTEDLTIISPQGTGRERGMQYSLGADVTVGYGFVSGSVDANYSRLQGNYKTVNATSGGRDAADGLTGSDTRSRDLANNIHTSDAAYNATHAWRSGQSGFYAGADGFDIENKGETRLLGGIITSDKSAEQNGYNRFVTDTLHLENVENHSSSKGFAIAANASYSKEQDKNTGEWQPGSLNSSRGATLHYDNQRGTTYAAIGTTNITIRDAAQQQAKTGHSVEDTIAQAQRDIWTDSAPGAGGATRGNLIGQDKLHSMAEEARVRREFRKVAFGLIDESINPKQEELSTKARAAWETGNKEEAARLFDEVYALQHQKNLLKAGVGAFSGVPGAAISQGVLRTINTIGRRETLDNSMRFKGIIDEKTEMRLDNISAESGAFDKTKLGGVRIDLDAICGPDDSRCSVRPDGTYIYKGSQYLPTLKDAIDPTKNKDAKRMYGATGGFQPIEGSLFGIKYKPGSFRDKVIEGYGGMHDLEGGQWPGFYDDLGNTTRHRTKGINRAAGTITIMAIFPVTPFAWSDILSEDDWTSLFMIGQ